MPSHNSKYYTKKISSNKVKSKNIATLFGSTKNTHNTDSDAGPSTSTSPTSSMVDTVRTCFIHLPNLATRGYCLL